MENPFASNFNYQYVITLSGVLVTACLGMHLGWPSPSLPQLINGSSDIGPITSSEGSWITTMPHIGLPLGCIIAAILADRVGRKRSLLTASPLFFIAWLMIINAHSSIVLMAARLIAGIGAGIGFTVLPMYIGEISNNKIRGLLGSLIQIATKCGYLVINITGIYLSIRVTAIVASVIPVLHFLTFSFMPESPYYLILKRQDKKATAVLKKINGKSNVEAEMSTLVEMRTKESKRSKQFIDRLTSFSSKKVLSMMLVFNTIELFTGYYTIAFYCLTIFMEAGGSIKESTATIVYFCAQLAATSVSSLLVDRTGRRPLLLVATTGSGCALAVAGIYMYLKNKTSVDVSNFGFVPLAALLLYTIMFNIGLTTIPILLVGEIFPIDVKAVCACISNIWCAVCSILVTKFFQIVKDKYGMHVPFFAFAFCCLMGSIFISIFIPETKGKPLEQIHIELESYGFKKEHSRETAADRLVQ